MAQIPQLERLQPSKTLPQNDRINLRVKDQGGEILSQIASVVKVADTGMQMYEMYEKDKINQISDVAEQEYTKWNNEQLQKLKGYQGDPTEAYAEYEKAVTQKKTDMIAARPNFGEDVLTAVSGRLDKTISHQSIQADHQRGQQQEIYDNNVFESTVKLKRDGLAVNAGFIQKGDPTSYTMFEQNIADIKTAVAKRGIKKGTAEIIPLDSEEKGYVFKDDNGETVKVRMSPIANARVAKDLSEGVKSSLDVLISTGRIEEARELQQRYGGVLTPAQTAKLESKYKSAGRKNEAHNFINSMKGLDEESQLEKIESIKDSELRSKVLQIKDRDERYINNLRSRKEKANYDTLGSYVLEKMNSNQPFFGMADLENDPMFQDTYDNLNVKQKKAIREMVEAPKESSEESLLKVTQMFANDSDGVDIYAIEPQDFQYHLSGLSKADKQHYTRLYERMRSQTGPEQEKFFKSSGTLLRQTLIADRIVRQDDRGNLVKKDYKRYTDAQRKLENYLMNNPSLRDVGQVREFIRTQAADLIKDQTFNPPNPVARRGQRPDDGRVPSDTQGASQRANNTDNIIDNMSQRDLTPYQRQYKSMKKTTTFPSRADAGFRAWMKGQLK